MSRRATICLSLFLTVLLVPKSGAQESNIVALLMTSESCYQRLNLRTRKKLKSKKSFF